MYVEVADTSEISEGGGGVYEIDGLEVAVFHVNGEFYAVENTCTHAGGSLGNGGLKDSTVMCPRHGAEFDVRTGEPLDTRLNPASEAVTTYDVKTEDGVIKVDI